MDIPFQLKSMYLVLLLGDNVTYKIKYLFQILTAAARKAITKKWLSPQTPMLNEWFDIIYDIFKLERKIFNIRLQQDKFEDKWSRWIEFITPIREELGAMCH